MTIKGFADIVAQASPAPVYTFSAERHFKYNSIAIVAVFTSG
jgi:hypothetical protein